MRSLWDLLRRPGRGLLASAVLLAALGVGLLTHRPGTMAADGLPQAPLTASAAPSTPSPSPRSSRTVSDRPPAAGPDAPGSSVPPVGDGPAGDAAVQRVLDRSSPADLPRAVEREAVALAARVWRADVTGAGRSRWPHYFPATAPARHLYTRVRIQAGIARTTDEGRVLVHLVWAGADPFGRYREGRTARVLLTENK